MKEIIPMKKSLLLFLPFVCAVGAANAQQPAAAPAVSPSIQVSTAVQTPQ